MAGHAKTSDAVEILRRTFTKDDPAREAAVEAERSSAEIGRMIYDMRKEAGLTQAQLAKRVGTTQSVISRLEDADYEGHSLRMLQRIAKALGKKLTVAQEKPEKLAFFLLCPDSIEAIAKGKRGSCPGTLPAAIQLLRSRRGLAVDDLAEQSGVPGEEIVLLETRHLDHVPTSTIRKLSQFFGISEKRMLALAGAVDELPKGLKGSAERFTEIAKSLALLTSEAEDALDELLQINR